MFIEKGLDAQYITEKGTQIRPQLVQLAQKVLLLVSHQYPSGYDADCIE